jgi:PAS domain S-box-containing protein
MGCRFHFAPAASWRSKVVAADRQSHESLKDLPAAIIATRLVGPRGSPANDVSIIGDSILTQRPQYAEAVLDALPEPIAVVDLDGRIEYANRQFLKEVGCTQQEAYGRTAADLGIVEDEEFMRLKAEVLPILLSGGSLTHVEILARRRGGGLFPSLVSFGLLRSDTGEPQAIVAWGRDIGPVKEVQEATAEKEKMLQALFQAIPEALLLIDREGRILTCNETAAKALNRSVQETVGIVLSDCLTMLAPRALWRRRTARIEEAFTSGKTVRFTDERDGHVLDNTFYPVMDDRGHVANLVIFARDITDQVLAQRELKKSCERMRGAERLASLGMLSAMLVHELTQPLSVVRLANETAIAELRDKQGADAITEDLEAGVRACATIAAIVSRFRHYARRSVNAKVAQVCIHNVAEWTIRLLAASAQQAKVTLRTEGLDALPSIQMRENELEQVFFALAQNGIEAADGVAEHYLLITAALRDSGIELRFEDDCGGIRPEDLPRVFEPFFTTKPAGKGTGLGLSIVHRIVRERGGRVSVQNQYGKGVTFVVTLPGS